MPGTETRVWRYQELVGPASGVAGACDALPSTDATYGRGWDCIARRRGGLSLAVPGQYRLRASA
eukprot:3600176-Rhodomonas_salina.2